MVAGPVWRDRCGCSLMGVSICLIWNETKTLSITPGLSASFCGFPVDPEATGCGHDQAETFPDSFRGLWNILNTGAACTCGHRDYHLNVISNVRAELSPIPFVRWGRILWDTVLDKSRDFHIVLDGLQLHILACGVYKYNHSPHSSPRLQNPTYPLLAFSNPLLSSNRDVH